MLLNADSLIRNDPWTGFRNGFKGFCTVFVTASFAYTGTELTGLAAAETENPRKEIPKASKQVVWRIAFFYIVNLFIVGLIVPADSELYSGEGSTSRRSPFVIAIQLAGIKVLPSIFNAVILIAVMSVANSCAFGSTRTMQALAANGKLFPTAVSCQKLKIASRNGPEDPRLRRQGRSSSHRGCHSAHHWSPRIHQFGSQWWRDLQLAVGPDRSCHLLRVW